MPERNTDDRDDIRRAFDATCEKFAGPTTVFSYRRWDELPADKQRAMAHFADTFAAARPDERAVREREREALSRLAEVSQCKGFRASEVCKDGHRDLADASDILAFRDREYPALPAPIPPCPLSGGREVRWEGEENFRIGFPGGQSASISLHRLIREAIDPRTDLRTLADWLDSLPDAERGKA